VPGFVVQGGEFVVTNRFETNLVAPNKLFAYPNFPAINNEYDVGRKISNRFGTIAMARVGGKTNSATSQWFFNLSDNSILDTIDGGFTVFGQVIGGTNVLNFFNDLSLFNGIIDLRFWYGDSPFGNLLKELPVRYPGIRLPQINELIYVDISLLHVRIEMDLNGGKTIRWNSAADRRNTVQFTEGFPPQWQSLHATNGTGTSMGVRDHSSTASSRFYRVIVE
jgi:cyclophilin family peptidyl-prolyl cis-trans isomerase